MDNYENEGGVVLPSKRTNRIVLRIRRLFDNRTGPRRSETKGEMKNERRPAALDAPGVGGRGLKPPRGLAAADRGKSPIRKTLNHEAAVAVPREVGRLQPRRAKSGFGRGQERFTRVQAIESHFPLFQTQPQSPVPDSSDRRRLAFWPAHAPHPRRRYPWRGGSRYSRSGSNRSTLHAQPHHQARASSSCPCTASCAKWYRAPRPALALKPDLVRPAAIGGDALDHECIGHDVFARAPSS